jgi:hypothetical protein
MQPIVMWTVIAPGAAVALRTRPLPQPTASSLVVEIIFFFFSCGHCATLLGSNGKHAVGSNVH